MWKTAVLILVVVAAIAFVSVKSIKAPSNIKDTKLSPVSEVQAPIIEIVAQGLEVPWALAFLPASPQGGPDGNILVTERIGKVRLIQNGKLLEKPIAILNVKQTGESGLHGIAIDPNFPQKPYVYLYYTYSASNNNSLNRVSSFVFDGQTLTDEKVIIDKIPWQGKS